MHKDPVGGGHPGNGGQLQSNSPFDLLDGSATGGDNPRTVLAALLLQIVTENGGTVSVETPILKESLFYSRSARTEELRLGNELLWGVTGNWELDFSAPLSLKQVKFAGERETLFGPGDASVRSKINFLKDDDVMKSTRVAGLVGLELPTGAHDEDAFPRKLQLGSGTWDPFFGAVFTAIDDRHRFSVDAIHRWNTTHDGVDVADQTSIDLAYWYRLHPAAFDPAESATEVRGVVELLATVTGVTRAGGRSLRDDGWVVRLAPGLQIYPSQSVLVEFNVQLPIFQDIDDSIGHRDLSALVAVKFLF